MHSEARSRLDRRCNTARLLPLRRRSSRAIVVMSRMIYPYDDAFRRRVARRCAYLPRARRQRTPRGLKRAAVAIPLLETEDGSGEAAFLLTRRAKGLRAHGGQWALPGGRCDAGETLAQAALRELGEEIGLRARRRCRCSARSTTIRRARAISSRRSWCGPGCGPRCSSTPRRSPPSIACRSTRSRARTRSISPPSPRATRRVVRMKINGSTVHAPTAALLYQFRELLAGRTTRVADLEQPVFAWR